MAFVLRTVFSRVDSGVVQDAEASKAEGDFRPQKQSGHKPTYFFYCFVVNLLLLSISQLILDVVAMKLISLLCWTLYLSK